LNHGTTLLFGLPGVRVARVERAADGGRVVHVVTADSSAAGCPECGTVSRSVKAKAVTAPKDLPYGEDPIRVVWHKTAPAGSAIGSHSVNDPRTRCGPRPRPHRRSPAAAGPWSAYRRGPRRCVAEASVAFGVSWPTGQAAFTEAAKLQLAEPEPTAVLGIDETRRGRPLGL